MTDFNPNQVWCEVPQAGDKTEYFGLERTVLAVTQEKPGLFLLDLKPLPAKQNKICWACGDKDDSVNVNEGAVYCEYCENESEIELDYYG